MLFDGQVYLYCVKNIHSVLTCCIFKSLGIIFALLGMTQGRNPDDQGDHDGYVVGSSYIAW